MKALSTAATGMLAQQLNVEVISNNIANMNTTGFKRQRAEFQDLLYQNVNRIGSTSSDAGTILPSGIQIGVGVRTGGVYRITEQGGLVETQNTYDLAINGRGFFRIQLPDNNDAYTRAGTFQVSAEGLIVTSNGYTVQPGITVPPDAIDVTINEQGQVFATVAGEVESQNVGQIELTTFPNDPGLEGIGNNLFLETPASGQAVTGAPGDLGFGSLQQGFVESSNVNPVQEITALITAQRAYEMNSKVITTADELMNATSNLR